MRKRIAAKCWPSLSACVEWNGGLRFDQRHDCRQGDWSRENDELSLLTMNKVIGLDFHQGDR